MEYFFDTKNVFLRAFVSLLFLFILAKLMGKKQISQMNFFDYCIGISIGSIAAEMAANSDTEFTRPLISMTIYALIAFIMSWLTNKSLIAKHIMNGTPLILIEHGKMLKRNFNKVRIDINEFLCECRVQGYFDISEIEYAIMETDGRVSILPKSDKRFIQPNDLNIEPTPATINANIILDGKIMEQNLKNIGRDRQWLDKQLKQNNIGSHKEVLLALCDEKGNFSYFLNDKKSHSNNVFE